MTSRPAPSRLLSFTVILLVALGAGGCGVGGDPQSEPSGPELPHLAGAEETRDQIARSESAIAAAAAEMSALATACPECVTVFGGVGSAAEERLALVGGMWEPWPDAPAEIRAELPEPAAVGDAPLVPEELVGYMSRTAQEQLAWLADADGLSPEETEVLASALLGRQVSAVRLGQFYGVSADEARKDLPLGATGTSAATELPAEGQPVPSAELPTTEGASQSGDQDLPNWGADPAAEGALVKYDCVASSLGFTDLSAQNPGVEQMLYDSLLLRNAELVAAGVPDARGLRCVLQPSSADDLLDTLLGADLELLTAGDPQVRLTATRFLWDDLAQWLLVGSPSEVHPGLTRAEATAQEDSPQS